MANKNGTLSALLGLIRPSHALMVFLVVVFLTGRWDIAIAPALACAFAFVDNDIQDWQVDRINQRDRPIAQGKLSLRTAKNINLLLFVLSLVLSLVHPLSVFTNIFLLSFSLLYNRFLKYLPLLGNIFVAFTMAVPFLYASLFSQQGYWTIAIIVFIFGLGREIIKDYEDREGDRAAGARTLAVLLGDAALWIGRGLVLAAALFYILLGHWEGVLALPLIILKPRQFRRVSLVVMVLILLIFFFQNRF